MLCIYNVPTYLDIHWKLYLRSKFDVYFSVYFKLNNDRIIEISDDNIFWVLNTKDYNVKFHSFLKTFVADVRGPSENVYRLGPEEILRPHLYLARRTNSEYSNFLQLSIN